MKTNTAVLHLKSKDPQKIYNLSGRVSTSMDADRYKVETTTTPDDPESWETQIDYGSLKRLEIRDLTAAQKIYVRVSAGNTHGWRTPSEPMSFIPR